VSNQSTPARTTNQRSVFTKSSEDLLKEYGLDFNKLSMANTIDFEAPAFGGAAQRPMVATPNAAKDKFDIFADLDPLQSDRQKRPAKGPAANFQNLNFDPLAPVAPPRGKKTSSDNWTTFE
jgi:hypothetical protein